MERTVLIVDDEQFARDALKLVVEEAGFAAEAAASADEAIRLVQKFPSRYLAAFVDYRLTTSDPRPEQLGDYVTKRIKAINPDVKVIMVSGDLSPAAFRAWAQSGVDRYLFKPAEPHQITSILEVIASESTKTRLAVEDCGPYDDEASQELLKQVKIIGASRAIVEVARETIKYASKDNTVLILGETGTGKERIATALHENSAHRGAPLIAINCANYKADANMLESELFGYEKGAFTGADKSTEGVFEAAKGGTVFLDEVHQLGKVAQAKLLRALQEKKIRRVGGKREINVNFRIVAAAKPDLSELVKLGEFSPDLYFRLKDLVIDVPPLRERVDDIKPLIFHFCKQIEMRENVHKDFEEACVERLRSYNWPGNVRELERLIGQLYAKVDGPVIRTSDLPPEISGSSRQGQLGSALAEERIATLAELSNEHERRQRELIVRALTSAENNVTKAAELLDVPRTTLSTLIKKFEIDSAGDKTKQVQNARRSWLGMRSPAGRPKSDVS